MRILITADCVGGIWRYALDIGREFADRGAKVIVACLGPRPSYVRMAEAGAAGVELIWLDAALDWMLRGPVGLRVGSLRLDALIRETSPDVVHLNAPAFASYMKCHCPCVVASHSCIATWWAAVRNEPLPAEWRWNFEATKAGLVSATCVLAPTAAFASMLRSAYGPLPSLAVVNNGIHPVRPNLKIDDTLAVGRWWDAAKDANTLDAAAALMRLEVHAAGPLRGPDGATATFRAARWLGELSHEAVLSHAARTKIFISPARYEPFGLAVLEAAAAGSALVLADIPSFRELWDGAAMFFPPGDAGALAVLADRIGNDDTLCAALAATATERASDFTVGRQVDSLLSIYAKAGATHRHVA